jgi:hypothetical protein
MNELSPIELDAIAAQFESAAVLKALIPAHRYLAELKGIHIRFGSGVMQTRAELDQRIRYLLTDNQQRLGVDDKKETDITGHFRHLCSRDVRLLVFAGY